MRAREIFRCQDKQGWWYLSGIPYDDVYEEVTEKTLLQQTTLEQLANLCDQDAGSDNNHEFVGIHRVLAALLYQRVGREQATMLMFDIACRGGLDGMAGIGGKQDSFAEFGIAEPWQDWKLPP